MMDLDAVPCRTTTLYRAIFPKPVVTTAQDQLYAIHDALDTIVYLGRGADPYDCLWEHIGRGCAILTTPAGRYLLYNLPAAWHWRFTVFVTPAEISLDVLEEQMLQYHQPFFNAPSFHAANSPLLPTPRPEPEVWRDGRHSLHAPLDVDTPQDDGSAGSARGSSHARVPGWRWLQRIWGRLPTPAPSDPDAASKPAPLRASQNR